MTQSSDRRDVQGRNPNYNELPDTCTACYLLLVAMLRALTEQSTRQTDHDLDHLQVQTLTRRHEML